MGCDRPSRRELQTRAKYMRYNPTYEERLMWDELRGKRLGGFKARRQHVLYPYIVDFFFLQQKLAVEIDGGSHDSPEEDEARAARILRDHGVRVLRFGAQEVRDDLAGVLSRILEQVEAA